MADANSAMPGAGALGRWLDDGGPAVPGAVAFTDPVSPRVLTLWPLPGISGGSALLAVGGRLLAVHDDAFRVTWIEPADRTATPWVLRGDGRRLPKSAKPDFEAAVSTADGLVHVLGSGCTSNRRLFARLDPATQRAEIEERADVYDCVRQALGMSGPPNIEGAIVAGERLRLFHRGSRSTPSASVDLPVGTLYGAAPRALATQSYDLGALDGVRLALTDVAALGPGRVLFVAAAEDTADAVADGPVAGSVLGIIDERGTTAIARWTRLCERDGAPCGHKVEGLAVDADRTGAWLLTDADDATRPALLGRVERRLFG